jgi:site-specific recombinase XerD
MLHDFQTYMFQEGYADSVVESYSKSVSKFIQWSDTHDIELESLDYKTWMRYQAIIRKKTTRRGHTVKDNTVKQEIGAIKIFFNFLVHEDILDLSPIKDEHYKDNSKYFHDELSRDQLLELYFCYPTQGLKHPKCPSVAIRNKVLLGLVIFQAIDTTTLKRMEVSHIDLSKKKIRVPGTKRSNPRTLDLNHVQMDAMRQYLEHDREVLQKKIKCFTEDLFPFNTKRFTWITKDICSKLRSINMAVTNLHQIRHWVLVELASKYDLRKAQKMAGHRYITSTERFLKTDVEDLREDVERSHPMA